MFSKRLVMTMKFRMIFGVMMMRMMSFVQQWSSDQTVAIMIMRWAMSEMTWSRSGAILAILPLENSLEGKMWITYAVCVKTRRKGHFRSCNKRKSNRRIIISREYYESWQNTKEERPCIIKVLLLLHSRCKDCNYSVDEDCLVD